MNAIVNFSAIEHAAAMANIQTPMVDIMAMFEGKIKPTKPVIDLYAKLKTGKSIEPVNQYSNIETRKYKDGRAKRQDYRPHIPRISQALNGKHLTVTELAELVGIEVHPLQNFMYRMSKMGIFKCQLSHRNVMLWFMPDYTDKVIEDWSNHHKNRLAAKKSLASHFEGVACETCSNTTRVTGQGTCLHCRSIMLRDYYLNKVKGK